MPCISCTRSLMAARRRQRRPRAQLDQHLGRRCSAVTTGGACIPRACLMSRECTPCPASLCILQRASRAAVSVTPTAQLLKPRPPRKVVGTVRRIRLKKGANLRNASAAPLTVALASRSASSMRLMPRSVSQFEKIARSSSRHSRPSSPIRDAMSQRASRASTYAGCLISSTSAAAWQVVESAAPVGGGGRSRRWRRQQRAAGQGDLVQQAQRSPLCAKLRGCKPDTIQYRIPWLASDSVCRLCVSFALLIWSGRLLPP